MLEKRSDMLLNYLLAHPNKTNKDLQTVFQLSRRQVDYTISKLNRWLSDKTYPLIKHTSSGHFMIPPALMKLMGSLDGTKNVVDWYIPSTEERSYVIVLMLITCEEQLSVNHFMFELEVSRNTVLRDLKEVHSFLHKFQLRLVYSRKEGYVIKGDEWNQRSAFMNAVDHLIHINEGEAYLAHYLKMTDEQIALWQKKIELIEGKLGIKFVDKKMMELPFLLEGIFRRIHQGKTIDNIFQINYKALSDTREYEAVEDLVDGQTDILPQERIYITLQLLSSNIISSNHYILDGALPQLEKALSNFLDQFEKNACITLKNKKILLQKLLVHFKPAYYRIKYRLTTNYNGLSQLSHEYKLINYFVKKSIQPLEQFIGVSIPDREVLFISLFIGSHLIQDKDQLDGRIRAAVVCTNGISISLLMENSLRHMFSYMFFYPAMSVREFKKFQYPIDVVFSAVPLKTEARLFVINEMMNEREKRELKQRVIKELYHLDAMEVDFTALMDVISRYADIKNPKKLSTELGNLFSSGSTANYDENISEDRRAPVQLDDLLTPLTIRQVDSVKNWMDALEKSASVLLQQNTITIQYIDTLKQLYHEPALHITLFGNIILPHAEPQNGVRQMSMSLLHIRRGIKVQNGKKAYFVVTLAAVDKTSHFNALRQLCRIAQSQSCIERMKSAQSNVALSQVIKEFLGAVKEPVLE